MTSQLPFFDDVHEYLDREPEHEKAILGHLANVRYFQGRKGKPYPADPHTNLVDMREKNRRKKANERKKARESGRNRGRRSDW